MPISKPTDCDDENRRLVLREATPDDIDLIVSMHARSWANAYRGLLPDAWLDGAMPAERAAHWRVHMKTVAAGIGAVWIAEKDGAPVGFVCVAEPDESGSVLVDNLHAMPGHRGLGAGTAMLAQAVRWARSRGAKALHLTVLEGNAAAIGFYESRGWIRVARESDHMAGIDLFCLRYSLPFK